MLRFNSAELFDTALRTHSLPGILSNKFLTELIELSRTWIFALLAVWTPDVSALIHQLTSKTRSWCGCQKNWNMAFIYHFSLKDHLHPSICWMSQLPILRYYLVTSLLPFFYTSNPHKQTDYLQPRSNWILSRKDISFYFPSTLPNQSLHRVPLFYSSHKAWSNSSVWIHKTGFPILPLHLSTHWNYFTAFSPLVKQNGLTTSSPSLQSC